MTDPTLPADTVRVPWRVGRRAGRTVYLHVGDHDQSDGSLLIGMMDTPEMAEHIVEVHNWWLDLVLSSEAAEATQSDGGESGG